MKTILPVAIIFLTMILMACGGSPQTATEPVLATQTLHAPTDTPLPESATETPVPTNTESPAAVVSFANHVMPILQTSCMECHGLRQVKEGLDLQTYETILAGSFNGPVIIPGNASESLLIQLVVEGEMPNRGPKLTAGQIQVIAEWINAGAQNN